jgi:hypothetical protein
VQLLIKRADLASVWMRKAGCERHPSGSAMSARSARTGTTVGNASTASRSASALSLCSYAPSATRLHPQRRRAHRVLRGVLALAQRERARKRPAGKRGHVPRAGLRAARGVRGPEVERPGAEPGLGREEVEVQERAVRVTRGVEREEQPRVLECSPEAPAPLQVAARRPSVGVSSGQRGEAHDDAVQREEERAVLRAVEVEPVHARGGVERARERALVREERALRKVRRGAVLCARQRGGTHGGGAARAPSR